LHVPGARWSRPARGHARADRRRAAQRAGAPARTGAAWRRRLPPVRHFPHRHRRESAAGRLGGGHRHGGRARGDRTGRDRARRTPAGDRRRRHAPVCGVSRGPVIVCGGYASAAEHAAARGAGSGLRMIALRHMVLLIGLCWCAVAALSAENWPQWRGPSLNGLSAEKNLPVRWSKTENITWKLPLPAWSGSTPIVWGDRIFLSVADDLRHREGENLFLWSIDRTKGTVLWKRPLGGGNHQERKQNMSSPSPVTDGKRVWVMTGTGILKAFDFDGKELWNRDIQKDYGRFGLNWG